MSPPGSDGISFQPVIWAMAEPMSVPGLEVDPQHADAGDRLGLDARDAADRGRERALADEDHPPLHVLGRQARVVPHDADDGDVDGREDVDHHLREREPAEKEDEERHHRDGVGAAEGEADDPHAEGRILMEDGRLQDNVGDWMCKRGGRGGAALGAPGTAPSKTFALRPLAGSGSVLRRGSAAKGICEVQVRRRSETPESRPRPRYGRQSMQADASGGGAAWTSRPAQGFRGVEGGELATGVSRELLWSRYGNMRS